MNEYIKAVRDKREDLSKLQRAYIEKYVALYKAALGKSANEEALVRAAREELAKASRGVK